MAHTYGVFQRNSCRAIKTITPCNAHCKTNKTVLKNTSTHNFFYSTLILLYHYLRIAVHTPAPNEVALLLVGTSYMA